MTALTRPTLGTHMSLVCFQYLRAGTEEVADRAPVVAAGRQRGFDLIEGMGLLGKVSDPNAMRQLLDEQLGLNGTRLCIVNAVTAKPDGGYEVRISEGACSAGQKSDVPHCAFTMGVFIGALHGLTGVRVRGVETECCACGAEQCVYQIDPI